jgi:hypothetical protein
MAHTKKPDQRVLIRLESSLQGNATSAVDAHDAHALTNPEDLILFDFLDIRAHGAVVFPHGNFHALGAGDALFGRRTEQTTRHRTDYSRHGTAATTANTAAGHTADYRTGTRTDWRLGAF